jgi:hypothetical protein
MGEFYAWAATGIVSGLQIWPKPNRDAARVPPRVYGENGRARTPTHRQRFLLRQQDGRDIEILLVDSGISFRNGDAITVVWAARENAPYGHCIYLENHTTGCIARLRDNLEMIRRKAGWWKVTLLGFLATLPASLGLTGWLLLKRDPAHTTQTTLFISAGVAATLLLIIGVVGTKLIFDYLNAEDERKIWLAADKALFHARRVLLERQRPQRYT